MEKNMRAIVWTAYGPPDVLQLQEVETPAPKGDEVRIKIHAATAFAGDVEMRALKIAPLFRLPMRVYIGLRRPKRIRILGQELAGEVESVGKAVRNFKEGDQIFAASGFRFGAYAEYVCLPEEGALATKPANMSYEEAAAVPVGGLEALFFLGQAGIQDGEKVLINGAGGSIGTFGVQLAKSYGAEVTAVDLPGKLEMLRGIGADHVIDYTVEDFTERGERYDVIFDVPGKSSFSGSVRSLKQNGRYLLSNASMAQRMRRRSGASLGDGKKLIMGTSELRSEDLEHLGELIEAGRLKTVIDRRYPLEQMAEAHKYVESGRKKGHVVVTVV
jgi:NADPH:quinone reductase-like Zn-dependent oxidoreductase